MKKLNTNTIAYSLFDEYEPSNFSLIDGFAFDTRIKAENALCKIKQRYPNAKIMKLTSFAGAL